MSGVLRGYSWTCGAAAGAASGSSPRWGGWGVAATGCSLGGTLRSESSWGFVANVTSHAWSSLTCSWFFCLHGWCPCGVCSSRGVFAPSPPVFLHVQVVVHFHHGRYVVCGPVLPYCPRELFARLLEEPLPLLGVLSSRASRCPDVSSCCMTVLGHAVSLSVLPFILAFFSCAAVPSVPLSLLCGWLPTAVRLARRRCPPPMRPCQCATLRSQSFSRSM